MEEGHGVGGVDEDGHTQPARGFPQRGETVVVGEEEGFVMVPYP
jgi:hypothetical protein